MRLFIVQALGGPANYKGADMRKAHAHMNLQEKEFDAIVELMISTLKELKVVDYASINEIA
jgi:hemoglobin